MKIRTIAIHQLSLIVCMILLTLGCGEADESLDGISGDDTDTSSPSTGQIKSPFGAECGKVSCEADMAAARAALINGNFEAAFNQYRCGNTVESAAGAALTRFATIVEGDEFTQLLKDFGSNTPLSFSDFMGKNGMLAQLGSHYDGRLELTLSDDATLKINARIEMDDGDRPAVMSPDGDSPESLPPSLRIDGKFETHDLDQDFWLYMQPAISLQSGDTISIEYNCDEGYMEYDPIIRAIDIDLSIETPAEYRYCSLYGFSTLPECPDRVGAIDVVSIGDIDAPVEFRMTDVPLRCSINEDNYELVYFSGTITGALHLGNDIDTTDMHPLFNDFESEFEDIPDGLTVNLLISHLAPAQQAFEEAACYADAADNGARGAVFNFPSELTGNVTVPITTRDTKLMAALFYGASALIQIVNAYDVPIQLGQMEEMSTSEIVDEINAHIGALKSDHQMASARDTLILAATKVIEAVNSSEDLGILRSNAYSVGGDAVFNTYATFVKDSLSNGLTAFPYTDPPVMIDLKALFTNPPDPSKISSDPLVVEIDEEWGDERVEGVELFFKALLQNAVPDFDYDMEDYQWFDDRLEDDVEDAVDEWYYASCEYFWCGRGDAHMVTMDTNSSN
ncbi:MAG: hypothetical protein JXX14_22875 [Deltaproteobacteria bacterium]|nr:hypothetical protein [Deltaproteobacteria bacterium]